MCSLQLTCRAHSKKWYKFSKTCYLVKKLTKNLSTRQPPPEPSTVYFSSNYRLVNSLRVTVTNLNARAGDRTRYRKDHHWSSGYALTISATSAADRRAIFDRKAQSADTSCLSRTKHKSGICRTWYAVKRCAPTPISVRERKDTTTWLQLKNKRFYVFNINLNGFYSLFIINTNKIYIKRKIL